MKSVRIGFVCQGEVGGRFCRAEIVLGACRHIRLERHSTLNSDTRAMGRFFGCCSIVRFKRGKGVR